MPTTNMNNTTPNWLSTPSVVIEVEGKRNAAAEGHIQPKTEGPSTMPATISPITGGCPIRRKIAPNTFATTMMTNSCRRRMLSGLLALNRALLTGCLDVSEEGDRDAAIDEGLLGGGLFGRSSFEPASRMPQIPAPN